MQTLSYREAGDKLYGTIGRLGLSEDARDSLVAAFKVLCAWIAGGDGRVGIYENGAMFQIFWLDVVHETDFDLLREMERSCDTMLATALARIEEAMTERARALGHDGEAYRAEGDELIETLADLCSTVLSADRSRDEELARLAQAERRLRAHAAELERAVGIGGTG